VITNPGSKLSTPEAHPSFASRVKTPYNGSFGGRGNKAALAELVQL
jgi:hypothetical protein